MPARAATRRPLKLLPRAVLAGVRSTLDGFAPPASMPSRADLYRFSQKIPEPCSQDRSASPVASSPGVPLSPRESITPGPRASF
jgi:hypothetical protein